MILAFWLFLGCAALAVVGGWLSRSAGDAAALTGIGLAIGGTIAAVIFLLAVPIITLERHYGRIGCRTFATQTHRQTRFVIYTAWDGGDCLTPDGSGHWIPTKNLREFGSKP